MNKRNSPSDGKTNRQALWAATTAQSFGVMGMQAFSNGVLLLFMTAMKFDAARILVYLALPNVISILFRLPAAYYADRVGKKKLGSFGLILTVIGFGIIPFSASSPQSIIAEALIVLGIVILSLGKMFFAASWMALLSPLVPEEARGRTFGTMRLVYQLVGIGFTAVCSVVLLESSSLSTFQLVLGFLTVCFALRLIFYQSVPEREAARPSKTGFWQSLLSIVRINGYVSFCAYVFLLMICTAGCRNLFSLTEKNVLNMSDSQVVMLVNMGMIGALLGHYLGGQAIDRIGTKFVFLSCHFSYAISIFLFLCRNWSPFPMFLTLGFIHFALGLVSAASILAISTELLALIPKENKSLSLSLGQSMLLGGMAISGLITAGLLKIGFIRTQWTFLSYTVSQYDAILLINTVLVLLLVVTLGLVPSVLKKSEWLLRDE